MSTLYLILIEMLLMSTLYLILIEMLLMSTLYLYTYSDASNEHFVSLY